MSLHIVSSSPSRVSDTKPVIELSDVAVRYRAAQEHIPSFKEYAIRWLRREIQIEEFWALQDISITVKPGEVLGIIGPNGAGKSTLLKVVARVLRPTLGRVRIRGRISPLLELGAGFDPELTGRENVYLNSAILGFSKRDIASRFDRIVQFAGLQNFIDAPLRTYSTGMAARLGFAVATDVRPEILIVDEILGVGDTEFQTKSFERIQSFQAEGTTILLVTHSLEQVQNMCSSAIWLDHGRMMLAGVTEQVVGKYIEKTTANEAERLAGNVGQVARDSENRWGSGTVEITDVCILGADNKEQSIFYTGQPFILEMAYIAHQPTPAPVFGLAMHHHDGTHITGPNSANYGLELPVLEGRGKIRYMIPSLPLLQGLYHVSVAVVNHDDTEVFDFHSQLYSFRVLNTEERGESYGLVTLGGTWNLTG
jgi:lipopolysaccharide transport system ATP-binding protein